jgi:hypothetical protein
MRARHRHFNARFADAALVLDSRFIQGLSNGADCTFWEDRSGGGRSPTETITPPKWFQYGLNGSASVRFDGINNKLLRVNNDNTLKTLTRSVIIVSKPDATMSGERCQFDVSFTYALTQAGTSGRWYKDTLANFTVPSLGTEYIFSVTDAGGSGASTGYVNGGNPISLGLVQSLPFSAGSTGRFAVGSVGSGILYFKGDIGLIVVIPINISNSIRKRCESSAAFSFKIPCS